LGTTYEIPELAGNPLSLLTNQTGFLSGAHSPVPTVVVAVLVVAGAVALPAAVVTTAEVRAPAGVPLVVVLLCTFEEGNGNMFQANVPCPTELKGALEKTRDNLDSPPNNAAFRLAALWSTTLKDALTPRFTRSAYGVSASGVDDVPSDTSAKYVVTSKG
jgi:hypothetical protein